MTARAGTETAAANLALGHAGQPEIADLSDNNTRARAVRQFFSITRDSLLREKWWSFAKGWITPAADPVQSRGPLRIRYVLPDDCVRVRYLQGIGDGAWDIESAVADMGGAQAETSVLVTNVVAPVVAITRRVVFVRLWDPVFLDAFAMELASRAHRKLGKSGAWASTMHAAAMERIATASAIDSKESSREKVVREASWAAARRGFRYR